jgi:hypothetical protein
MPSSSPISVNSNRFERLGGGAEELAELMVDIWALGRDLCDEAQGLRLRNEKSDLDHKTSPEVHKPLQYFDNVQWGLTLDEGIYRHSTMANSKKARCAYHNGSHCDAMQEPDPITFVPLYESSTIWS